MSDAVVCADCDPDSPDALAVRMGLRTENGGTPGGTERWSPPARAVLAVLVDHHPEPTPDSEIASALRRAGVCDGVPPELRATIEPFDTTEGRAWRLLPEQDDPSAHVEQFTDGRSGPAGTPGTPALSRDAEIVVGAVRKASPDAITDTQVCAAMRAAKSDGMYGPAIAEAVDAGLIERFAVPQDGAGAVTYVCLAGARPGPVAPDRPARQVQDSDPGYLFDPDDLDADAA